MLIQEDKMNILEAKSVFNSSIIITLFDLKKAYRSMANNAHPDKGGNNNNMARINTAYQLLKGALPHETFVSSPTQHRHTMIVNGLNRSADPTITLKVANYSLVNKEKRISSLMEAWIGTVGLSTFHEDIVEVINTNYSGQEKYKGADIFLHECVGANQPYCTVWFKGNEIQLFIS